MKKLLLAALFTLSILPAFAQQTIGIGQWVVVNASAATPVVLTNAVTLARRVTFVGNKDNRNANTGTVYIGTLPTNDTQPIAIQSGQSVSLLIPENTKIDLSGIYLDVTTANDGVLIIYE